MHFIILPDKDTFKLHRAYLLDKGKTMVRSVFSGDMESVIDRADDVELKRFYLAIQVLIEGERKQRYTVQQLTTSGSRNVKTWVKRVADYLEIYRYPAIVRQRKNKAKRKKSEMVMYNQLDELLRSAFLPIKQLLRFPDENPSEYSYHVPASVLTSVSDSSCKNYLESFKTYGFLSSSRAQKVFSRLRRDYAGIPGGVEAVIEGIIATASHDHLSAISFGDSKGQLIVSIVNVNGDLLQMEGYKFLRLVEEHDNTHGGWLSLGGLDREKEWLPVPNIKFNKQTTGEIIARYVAADSCIDAKCRVIDEKNSNITKSSGQALFVIDQDYLICLYVAIVRLKNDKKRFEDLREMAEMKNVTGMDVLEAAFFD